MTKQEADRIIKVMDGRFTAVDKRFETIDKRFEAIDKRFETIDKRFKTMLDYVNGRFDDIESNMVTQDQWSKHMELMDRIMGGKYGILPVCTSKKNNWKP